jgi:lipid II isoglutaminyl synthase (glutamine-hydrolysing)
VSTSRAKIDLRLTSAVAAGKLAGLASRQLGIGGGTSLPGVIATRLDGAVLGKLARGLPHGTVLVTGTNGKTTTSRLLASFMTAAGWHPVHNRAGANLASGLTTALLERAGLAGQATADSALFEVDEAVLPQVQAAVRPRAIVLTNLFRDQLDRYGEVDYVASVWRQALGRVPEGTTVVLNADDPALAAIGRDLSAAKLYYGIDAPVAIERGLDHFADSKNCPFCGTALRYDVVRYAHLGRFSCPNADFARPPADVSARTIEFQGVESTRVEVAGPFGARTWQFKLPGLYNVYNLLAAVAGGLALGLPLEAIDAGVRDVAAAFGRLERIPVGDKTLFFALIKNPVGFTEVMRTVLTDPGEKDLAIFINDNLADGTDVSWLWDADVELLAGRCRRVVVGGTRVGDMAVRLKYAGVPSERIIRVESVAEGLDAGLSGLPPGGTLYVLPTYTAMLDLRRLVGQRGYARHYWES